MVASDAPGDGKTTVARHLAAAARMGRNRRDVAQRLHETLTGAGAPLLGVVANGFKSGRLGGYGYGYSYDYAAGGGKAASVDGGAPAGGVSPNGASASEAPVPTSRA